MHNLTTRFTVLFLLAAPIYLSFIPGARAVDLVPFDVETFRVGACDQQVRLKVKVNDHNGKAAKGGSIVSYRVGVYSSRDRALITSFPASDQKPGESYTFVVPSDSLVCESGVKIVIDDLEQVSGDNKSNNSVSVSWKQPGKQFGSACAVQLERCPR